MKIWQTIQSLLRKKKKGSPPVSAYVEKLKKQPHYTAKYLGAESGKRGLRDRWQRRAEKSQKKQEGEFFWQKGGRRWRPLLFFFVFAALLVWGAQQLLLGPLHGVFEEWSYFRIQNIEVSGCRLTNPLELKKVGGINYQLNMLTLDPVTIQNRLQEHPWITQATVRRIWPDSLIITVKENRPEALVVHGAENSFSYLNEKGKVFASVQQGQELDFPVVTGLDDVPGSELQNETLAQVIVFLQLARRNNPNLPVQNISEIHLTAEGKMIVYLVRNPFPIYFGKGNIKRKYHQLRKVLEVLYAKRQGGSLIEKVAYIRMDYQENKVLVARSSTG